jgi:16S rRNA C1402 (ribose-2'-O) methylase RsmI
VADPGAALVAVAHAQGVPVLPLAGASSLLLALAASGLNGQSFAFVGYLPQEVPGAPHGCASWKPCPAAPARPS